MMIKVRHVAAAVLAAAMVFGVADTTLARPKKATRASRAPVRYIDRNDYRGNGEGAAVASAALGTGVAAAVASAYPGYGYGYGYGYPSYGLGYGFGYGYPSYYGPGYGYYGY